MEELITLKKNPPKVEGIDDVTGEPLIHRNDDKREVIKARLDVYYSKTLPVSSFYANQGLLTTVDSMQPIEKVYNDIKSKLML